MKKIVFVSFGHWTPSPHSRVRTGAGALLQSILRAALVYAALCGAAPAAETAFRSTIVTNSYIYQRPASSFKVLGLPSSIANTVDASRVTVALDGFLVSGEWVPKTSLSISAKNFRQGTDVLAAVERNRLLLKTPAGDVVTANIVSREKQQQAGSKKR
jgi:hypothetical protein